MEEAADTRTFNVVVYSLTLAIRFCLVCILFIGHAARDDDISDELIQDTTWSGTCVLSGKVIVPAGVVLKIEPGTILLMKDAASIMVYGQLLAEGTESQLIRFTRYDAGMSLSTTGSPADLNHDDMVDAKDLQAFADLWLKARILLAEDINRDGVVSLFDFSLIADDWLQGP